MHGPVERRAEVQAQRVAATHHPRDVQLDGHAGRDGDVLLAGELERLDRHLQGQPPALSRAEAHSRQVELMGRCRHDPSG